MIAFNTDFSPAYGECINISPLISRVVANNPSPFTFHGTGTYIVGDKNVAVIDPGPAMPSHIHALEKALAGKTVSHILVTHNHMDHSPAAKPLQQITGAKIYGYDVSSQKYSDNRTEEGLDKDYKPDHVLKDGDVIKTDEWTFEAIFTPGHISNHLCFALEQEKALFSGDHVMGWSTSVVSPPDGNMKDYFASLDKLLLRDDQRYYPTHGNPIDNPQELVQQLITHRRDREEQILACIKGGARTIPQMVDIMYAAVPTYLHPAAARSVLAHLIHMTGDGRLISSGPVNETSEYSLAKLDHNG